MDRLPPVVLVDHLELTFKDHSPELLQVLFTPVGGDLDGGDWSELPVGFKGYKTGASRGQVRMYWDGREDMGVHIVCGGQACRQIEGEGLVTDWREFAETLLAWGATVSRLDIAFDDRAGALDIAEMERCAADRRIVGRFKEMTSQGKLGLHEGSTAGGKTLYFGSSQSRVRVRVYDKRAEQIAKGCDDPGAWVRVELQTRDERADWCLKALACEDSSYLFAGLLWNYLDFKQAGSADTNRSRWQTCEWWADWLGAVQKVRLSVSPVVRTVERTVEWLNRQVATALAVVADAPGFGVDTLRDLIENGRGRMRSVHKGMIRLAATQAERMKLQGATT